MGIQENEAIGQVRQALARDPALDSPKITITTTGESIALAGVLDSAEAVARAGTVATRAASGIPVDNGLTVGEPHHHRRGEE